MTAPASPPATRARWLSTLHQWHWVSAAASLMAMLLFTLTGFTLNHAADIEGRPQVTQLHAQVPSELLADLPTEGSTAPLPPALRYWLEDTWQLSLGAREAEFSADEVYLSLPRPGGDAWLRIDPESGEIEYEHSDRGWIAWANDLHKGRHTGAAWAWFIDLIAVGSLVFSLSGLWILHRHAAQRAATWPLVAAGAVLPLLIILLCFH